MTVVEDLLAKLLVPFSFARRDGVPVPQDALNWKKSVSPNLNALREILGKEGEMDLQTKTRCVSVVAVFDADVSDAEWTDGPVRDIASDILSILRPCPTSLISSILSSIIKPLFIANSHPAINLETGRKLPRLAGGQLAAFDYMEHQKWKARPDVGMLLGWCVRNIESKAYGDVWHLLIPPLMTMLDDFEAKWKLAGVGILGSLIENAPADLLKRTGLSQLASQSLENCIAHLHSPVTPTLLRDSIRTAIALTLKTIPPDSLARFNAVTKLLGESIIGTVWPHASREPLTVASSLYALIDLMQVLGIGTVRFLKVIIPQLSHGIYPPVGMGMFENTSRELRVASLDAMRVLIGVCGERMFGWRGDVIDATAKCWVALVDSKLNDEEVRQKIISVYGELALACPSVIQHEYAALLSLDSSMFRDVVKGEVEVR